MSARLSLLLLMWSGFVGSPEMSEVCPGGYGSIYTVLTQYLHSKYTVLTEKADIMVFSYN